MAACLLVNGTVFPETFCLGYTSHVQNEKIKLANIPIMTMIRIDQLSWKLS